jgi:hypothetical protein
MEPIHSSTRGGFIGLVSILIAALIITWWVVYRSPLANTASDTPEQRDIGIDAITDAKDIKNVLESRNAILPTE